MITVTNRYELQGDTLKLYVWDYHAKRNRVALLDASDYDLVARGATFWHAAPARKSTRKWYVGAKVWMPEQHQCRLRLLHRWLLGLIDRKIEVDHIDNDGLNNRRSNLRTCTHKENMRFRKPAQHWVELDAMRLVAEEYRQERAIAQQVQVVYGLSRAGLYKIRMGLTSKGNALAAYQSAITAAGIRPLRELTAAFPREGKFGLMVR
jgi:hypothetical protein